MLAITIIIYIINQERYLHGRQNLCTKYGSLSELEGIFKFTVLPHQFLMKKLKWEGLSDSSKVPKVDNAEVSTGQCSQDVLGFKSGRVCACASRGRGGTAEI